MENLFDVSRRSFLKGAASMAATAPLVKTMSALPLAVANTTSRSAKSTNPPEMVKVPEYMVYARVPDGRVIGMCHAGKNGQYAARYSSDQGKTWTDPQPLFELDGSIGSWAVHNAFLDHDGELQLILTNDAHTTGHGKSLYDIHYDIWHLRSRNGRRDWNAPVSVWKGYAGSLLSFIQLRNGRVLLPFCYLTHRNWANRGTGFEEFTYVGRFSSTAAYSDDNGQTWTLSPDELYEPTPNLYADGGIEPIALQLKDGAVRMMIRTQDSRFFESMSEDGSRWSHPLPTSIMSSDSPCSLTRLHDGRVVMLWNNTQRFPYANGGRAVLHGAISDDDGRTWRGYREVAANPFDVEPPPRHGDHGVTYTVPTLTQEGTLITSLSVGGGNGYYLLRVDPEWLSETAHATDLSKGLQDGWSTFGTKGVELVANPANAGHQVLGIKHPDPGWPAGATWNFPSGRRGELRLRIYIAPEFGGGVVGLTDHFSVPFDEQDVFYNLFNFEIGAKGVLAHGSHLPTGRWNDLHFQWDCDRRECRVIHNGQTLALAPLMREQTPGPSYLRLRSTSHTPDNAGMFVESASVNVS